MRFIVTCAAEGEWGDHLGVPKHLIPVEGERLLDRTVRLFSPYGEVIVTGPDDHRYRVPPSVLWFPPKNPANHEADVFVGTRELWASDQRTVYLYGDCWFSDAAAHTIVTMVDDWQVYGRAGPSTTTGTPWGEQFAFGFDPEHHGLIAAALGQIIGLRRDGVIHRNCGWELYRSMTDIPLDRHELAGHFVEIDDFTDDFDYPVDYERWTAARGRS